MEEAPALPDEAMVGLLLMDLLGACVMSSSWTERVHLHRTPMTQSRLCLAGVAGAFLALLQPHRSAGPASQPSMCCREAMQGLLRKLGAGFGDLVPNMTSSTQFKVCLLAQHCCCASGAVP